MAWSGGQVFCSVHIGFKFLELAASRFELTTKGLRVCDSMGEWT